MPEHRTLFDLPAAKLTAEDIEALAELVTAGLVIHESMPPEYSASKGDVTYRSNSIEELLNQKLPQPLDRMSFRARGWSEFEIDKGITVDLSRVRASCHLHSTDPIWFKGMADEVRGFFRARRRWYHAVLSRIPILLGVLQGVLVAVAGASFAVGRYVIGITATVGIVLLSRVIALQFAGRVLPVIDFQLHDAPKVINREVLIVVFAGVSALAAVVSSVFPFVSKYLS